MDGLIPFFLPMPIPTDDGGRAHRLEQELAVCQSLLILVLDHIGRTDPAAQTPPLGRILAATDAAEADRIAVEIDRHLSAKRQDLALRLLREEAGLTWDDLYVALEWWVKLSAGRKRRWIQYARLGNAARAVESA